MFDLKNQKFLFIVLLMVIATPVGAYVASSANYRIQADSVNFGGEFSSSANYKLQDTLGEIGTGTSSDNFNLHAGYQAMNEDVYLTITPASNVTLSPAINTTNGGVSSGSATWSVDTNNPAGYSLAIASDASPALRSSDDNFADLATTPGTAIYDWSVPVGQAAFGYSVDGVDTTNNFLDNGSSCGIVGGTDSSDKCWTSFSTSYNIVSLRGSATSAGGNQTTVLFKAETTATRALKSGNYQTAVDVLALAL